MLDLLANLFILNSSLRLYLSSTADVNNSCVRLSINYPVKYKPFGPMSVSVRTVSDTCYCPGQNDPAQQYRKHWYAHLMHTSLDAYEIREPTWFLCKNN